MDIVAPFLVGAWILTFCPRGSATSMGHSLPAPLQENPLFSPPAGSNLPAVGEEGTSPPTHLRMPHNYAEDDYYYDIEEDLLTPEPPTPGVPQPLPPRCDYNHCQHLQVPCAELSRAEGCLCPGISGPDVAPEAPRLQVIHTTEAGASVRWCAPSSTVLEYRLHYRPVDGTFISGPAMNSTSRLAVVSGLSPGQEYLFCVVASNRAGSSPTNDGVGEHGPCRLARTPARQMPYVYVASGLASVLGLLVVSVLAWHFWYRKKKHLRRGSLDNILDGESGLEGTANASFRTEEQL
ncbi:LRRN4 C-terminal-like protein [Pogona vitticeps]